MLFYAIATVFQLNNGGDMMYESRRKPEPTLLPTQRIVNLPHHIGTVWEELTFDDVVHYTQPAQLNVMAVTGIGTPVSRVTYPTL